MKVFKDIFIGGESARLLEAYLLGFNHHNVQVAYGYSMYDDEICISYPVGSIELDSVTKIFKTLNEKTLFDLEDVRVEYFDDGYLVEEEKKTLLACFKALQNVHEGEVYYDDPLLLTVQFQTSHIIDKVIENLKV